MECKFKCPVGTEAVVIDFQQFDADKEGTIVAPLRYRKRLEDLGFSFLGEAKPPQTEETEDETEEPVAEQPVEETEDRAEVAEPVVEESGKGRRKRS